MCVYLCGSIQISTHTSTYIYIYTYTCVSMYLDLYRETAGEG